MFIVLFLLKNKSSLFESRPRKKPRLIGLCDGWGLVTTYGAATDAATVPNQLQTIEIQILNEGRIVKTAFSSKAAENRGFWTWETCLPA